MLRVLFGFAVALAIVYLTLSHFDKSNFMVKNASSKEVFVVAKWRENELELGYIGIKEKLEFNLNAEASMTFIVTYPNGSVVSSEPIYFTSGVDVEATIFDNKVKADYESNT